MDNAAVSMLDNGQLSVNTSADEQHYRHGRLHLNRHNFAQYCELAKSRIFSTI